MRPSPLAPVLSRLRVKRSAGVWVTPAAHRHILMGNAARDSRAWGLAVDAYGRAVKTSPDLPHVWIQLGHAHKELGQFAQAATAYEQARRLDPADTEVDLSLGHVAKLSGDLRAAARHYAAAAEASAPNQDAVAELRALISKGIAVDIEERAGLAAGERGFVSHILTLVHEEPVEQGGENDDGRTALVFDISDLIAYFQHARTPTGIQRVQLEILKQAFRSQEFDVRICAFQERRDEWVEIPRDEFLKLAELATDGSDQDWAAALTQVSARLMLGRYHTFPRNAFLINLGTSWWIPNYFMYVRKAKEERGIRYVPFVHDMIPIICPDICPPLLVRDFKPWAAGIFEHADFYLVNSASTKRDLSAVASFFGQPIAEDRIEVVPLDACLSSATRASDRKSIVARSGLKRGGYVLFVSTIEPRKNHILAFEAWLQLAKRHRSGVPQLVCVGASGWMNEPIHEFLRTHGELKGNVTVLSNLSDQDLSELYDDCLFTLYPSKYEGWGLPVTEALCHGKVALCSRVSSIPEAGGRFADYFSPGSRSELLEGLEVLCFNKAYRREREDAIRQHFRPRSWSEVAEQIVARCHAWRECTPASPAAAQVVAGRYYPLSRDLGPQLWPGLRSPDRLRGDFNWWALDPWGCWTKPGGARLAFTGLDLSKPHRMSLLVQSMPNTACTFRVDVNGEEGLLDCTLAPHERRWVQVDVPPLRGGERGAMAIDLVAADREDLSTTTTGGDMRSISLGVCGFYICEAGDMAARMNLVEAIATDALDTLSINQPARGAVKLAAFLESRDGG